MWAHKRTKRLDDCFVGFHCNIICKKISLCDLRQQESFKIVYHNKFLVCGERYLTVTFML